ncbi:MAG TPA: CrcB family protein [Trebonia sp.]|jgi:CrcB protein|nr:CrcB family protein [Trebonia sp.]
MTSAEGGRGAAQSTTLRRRVTLVAAIGTGGAVGAAARYGTELAVPASPAGFPVATLLVNVVGAVILGAIAALPAAWLAAHALTRPAIGTGFCGGLTTFSTMTLEIYERWAGHTPVAAAYAAVSLVAAPACAWTGFSLASTALSALRERQSPPAPQRKVQK